MTATYSYRRVDTDTVAYLNPEGKILGTFYIFNAQPEIRYLKRQIESWSALPKSKGVHTVISSLRASLAELEEIAAEGTQL